MQTQNNRKLIPVSAEEKFFKYGTLRLPRVTCVTTASEKRINLEMSQKQERNIFEKLRMMYSG